MNQSSARGSVQQATGGRNPGGRRGRGIVERIEITGRLVLETPAHLGGGEADGLTDVPLLRDASDGRTPLLLGTSIAGALRCYLHNYLEGYRRPTSPKEEAARLFGDVDGKSSVQSWLVVEDALGSGGGTEIRDGVALDPATRTAADNKKFDLELLQAGTCFELSFELLLRRGEEELARLLALALRGLEHREIGIGARKQRGLGLCYVPEWTVRRYRMTDPHELVAWLAGEDARIARGSRIVELLGVGLTSYADRRQWFEIDATLYLDSSLLIRSASGSAADADMVHLHSFRDGKQVPVLTGTSLAGAVRARALRIANTVLGDGTLLVNQMFGRRIQSADDEPSGSRVVTHEVPVAATENLVHGRVKIDRFTGGAYPQALFFQQPLFGTTDSEVRIQVILQQPRPAEIGLLLLVLKDLWTGDLALGGESSVGRGRLRGGQATLALHDGGAAPTIWRLSAGDGELTFGGSERDRLEAYVRALHDWKEETR